MFIKYIVATCTVLPITPFISLLNVPYPQIICQSFKSTFTCIFIYLKGLEVFVVCGKWENSLLDIANSSLASSVKREN